MEILDQVFNIKKEVTITHKEFSTFVLKMSFLGWMIGLICGLFIGIVIL